MAVKKKKSRGTNPARVRHQGPKHIPLDEHRAEAERFRKARDFARSREGTFAPEATSTRRRGRRRGTSPAAAGPTTVIETLDLRTSGRLPAVRQQPDGDERCVGFSLACAMEAWLGLSDAALNLPNLSEQHVFELGGEKKIVSPAAKAVKSGVVESRCFEAVPQCPDQLERTWKGRIREIEDNSTAALCEHLRNKQPIITELRVAGNFGAFTGSGVYSPDNTPGGAHAMVIVGFQRNSDRTGFWILENSLGTTWGDQGFGRIRWGDEFCQPEGVVFVVEEVTRAS